MGSLSGKRIAIYARFSSDKQSDTSIEDQVYRARARAEAEGGSADPLLTFTDYAISGASMDRPGMRALIDSVERGAVDVVVAESLDRISRDVGDADRFRKALALHGVELQCLDGTLVRAGDKSAALLFGVRSLFAEAYLLDLSDKTRRGLEGRARCGKATGAVPYGYRLVPTGSGSDISVDPERALIVERIFSMYASGSSFAGIASVLNAECVPPPRPHSRRSGSGWMHTAIRSMLLNERYRGHWVYGAREWFKVPGTHRRVPRKRSPGPLVAVDRPDLAIVDPTLWSAVQARFSGRERDPHRGHSQFPLSGLLRCGRCGGVMTCVGGTPRRYGCANAYKRGTCPYRSTTRVDAIEHQFFETMLARWRRARHVVESIAEQEIAASASSRNVALVRVAKAVERAEREVAHLTDAITDAGPVPALVSRLKVAEAHRLSLMAEAARTTSAPVRSPTAESIVNLGLSHDGLASVPTGALRMMLAAMLDDAKIECVPVERGVVLRWSIEGVAMVGVPGTDSNGVVHGTSARG